MSGIGLGAGQSNCQGLDSFGLGAGQSNCQGLDSFGLGAGQSNCQGLDSFGLGAGQSNCQGLDSFGLGAGQSNCQGLDSFGLGAEDLLIYSTLAVTLKSGLATSCSSAIASIPLCLCTIHTSHCQRPLPVCLVKHAGEQLILFTLLIAGDSDSFG